MFYLPIVGNREQIMAGMAGTKEELYQQMLHDISAQAQLADTLGYDSMSFTEHHLHIEGFEVSNNPVLLDFAPFGFNKGMAGTVDTVKRQLEKMRERLPVNWVFAWMYNGVLENSVLLNTIEKFGARYRRIDRGAQPLDRARCSSDVLRLIPLNHVSHSVLGEKLLPLEPAKAEIVAWVDADRGFVDLGFELTVFPEQPLKPLIVL